MCLLNIDRSETCSPIITGRVIGKEQKALEEQLSEVVEQVAKNTKVLISLDAKLLQRLSQNDGNLLDDDELIGVCMYIVYLWICNVCMCVYVYMQVCMETSACVCVFVCWYVCVEAYAYFCRHACVSVPM